MTLFYEAVAHLLAPHVSMTVPEVVAALTTPPDSTLGDVAFPCFGLAKAWRQAPQAIAAALASRLPVVAPVVRITAVGPYLNIHLDRALATTQLLTTIDGEGSETSMPLGFLFCWRRFEYCSRVLKRRTVG